MLPPLIPLMAPVKGFILVVMFISGTHYYVLLDPRSQGRMKQLCLVQESFFFSSDGHLILYMDLYVSVLL